MPQFPDVSQSFVGGLIPRDHKLCIYLSVRCWLRRVTVPFECWASYCVIMTHE